MEMEIKNGTVFDGIIKIEFFYQWRPIIPTLFFSICSFTEKKSGLGKIQKQK
jgi:hypothetical protein